MQRPEGSGQSAPHARRVRNARLPTSALAVYHVGLLRRRKRG